MSLTSGLRSILSRLIKAVFDVSKSCDVNWFINCWIGSTGADAVLGLFVMVAVLYGLTFTHGLDDEIWSDNALKIKTFYY